jgi:predicted Rdx family selenoprotein
VAEVLREELGIEAELARGHGGIFTVAVDGEIVSRKTLGGFPTEDEVLHAVATRLGA